MNYCNVRGSAEIQLTSLNFLLYIYIYKIPQDANKDN